jgi:hypothetical protein
VEITNVNKKIESLSVEKAKEWVAGKKAPSVQIGKAPW